MLMKPDQELLRKQIIECPEKDTTGLNDFQKIPDENGITIPFVGISRYRIPMNFKHDFGIMTHDVEASTSVQLSAGKTGINMSRLCQILQDSTLSDTVSAKLIKNILIRIKDELRDSTAEPMLSHATLKLRFKFPVKQKSLKSDNWGWQYYDAILTGEIDQEGKFALNLSMDYEYSSTCPCSLSMAKQYEQDFENGITDEGNGIAVPHGQRSRARVLVKISELGLSTGFFLQDLLQIVKTAIPTETQSLVKRIDEQAFAILNGTHPMFVEHVAKKLVNNFNQCPYLEDWIAQIEHFESLHSHNAAAVVYKGIVNGFNKTDLFS